MYIISPIIIIIIILIIIMFSMLLKFSFYYYIIYMHKVCPIHSVCVCECVLHANALRNYLTYTFDKQIK